MKRCSCGTVLNSATIIEKHFKSDDDKKSVDRHFSMKISNLKNAKNDLTGIKKAMGEYGQKAFVLNDKIYNTRRSIYVSKKIKRVIFFQEIILNQQDQDLVYLQI